MKISLFDASNLGVETFFERAKEPICKVSTKNDSFLRLCSKILVNEESLWYQSIVVPISLHDTLSTKVNSIICFLLLMCSSFRLWVVYEQCKIIVGVTTPSVIKRTLISLSSDSHLVVIACANWCNTCSTGCMASIAKYCTCCSIL